MTHNHTNHTDSLSRKTLFLIRMSNIIPKRRHRLQVQLVALLVRHLEPPSAPFRPCGDVPYELVLHGAYPVRRGDVLRLEIKGVRLAIPSAEESGAGAEVVLKTIVTLVSSFSRIAMSSCVIRYIIDDLNSVCVVDKYAPLIGVGNDILRHARVGARWRRARHVKMYGVSTQHSPLAHVIELRPHDYLWNPIRVKHNEVRAHVGIFLSLEDNVTGQARDLHRILWFVWSLQPRERPSNGNGQDDMSFHIVHIRNHADHIVRPLLVVRGDE
mmetsp:Transcript_6627/g.12511  ORF Transcript_6627/g.12511 Transcript_6627/m.12511 type:complete len:270 (+) Transcript_6627:1162-1971(+)